MENTQDDNQSRSWNGLIGLVCVVVALVAPWVGPDWKASLVVVMVSAIVVGFLAYGAAYDELDGWFAGAAVVVVSYVAYLLVMMVMANRYDILTGDDTPRESRWVLTDTEEIWSLRGTGMGSTGTFVLGSGKVDASVVYIAERRTDDGGYQRFVIGGQVTLYDDIEEGHAAYVETFQEEHRAIRPPIPEWVQHAFGFEPEATWGTPWYSKTHTKLHVPKGTIVQANQL